MSVLDLVRRLARRDQGEGASIILAKAREAQAEGRWALAATFYQQHALLRPRRAGTALQLGNMLKELGRLDEAEAAYRRSLALRDTSQARVQLGYLMLDQGRLEEAADIFVFALERQRRLVEARQGLIMAGARDRLPLGGRLSPQKLESLRRLTQAAEVLIDEAADAEVTPLRAYDAWRRRRPIPAPPALGQEGDAVAIRIDARGVSPFLLRATLQSIVAQSLGAWRTWVLVDETIRLHPVASIAAEDIRISLMKEDRLIEGPVLHVPAGVALDPSALAWFCAAAEMVDADAIYADHDHVEQRGMAGEVRADPVFHPAPSGIDLETTPRPPKVVFSRLGPVFRRADLAAAARAGRAAHLPLVLSSVVCAPAAAMSALPEPGDRTSLQVNDEPPTIGKARRNDAILVIIPTRDEAEMLERCIRSLVDRAAEPGGVRILVMDNRSVEIPTRSFLENGVATGAFEVTAVDEPFNWSRLNNLGAAKGSEGLLLFLNNDTEILTEGWDDRLRSVFADPGVGAAGAKLLYPDGQLQHGGLVLGLGDGTPRHEGVGNSSAEAGPEGRWRRRREAAAVTGAFLATPRSVFDAVGGFDPEMAVAYNDIDYCLAVRATGKSVVYAGDIAVTHYESRTRGRDRTRSRVAWDLAEQTSLANRWGAALLEDPSVNPHWRTGSPRPFDGFRQPSIDEVLTWIRPHALHARRNRA